jgi:hypothetical protein
MQRTPGRSDQATAAGQERARSAGVIGRLLLLAAITTLATGCAYPYYSYPYYYGPYSYGPYSYGYPGYPYYSDPLYAAQAVVERPSATYQSPPVQREVVHPHGKYVLYGDGVSEPWQWVWVPAPAPSSSPPR